MSKKDTSAAPDLDIAYEDCEESDYSEERAWLDANFPKTRGECKRGPRPCLFFRCKYNLVLDVSPKTGRLTINFDPLEERGIPTCALDVADEGGKILEDIGDMLGVTRERIRQIGVDALYHLQIRNRETLEDLRKEYYED